VEEAGVPTPVTQRELLSLRVVEGVVEVVVLMGFVVGVSLWLLLLLLGSKSSSNMSHWGLIVVGMSVTGIGTSETAIGLE